MLLFVSPSSLCFISVNLSEIEANSLRLSYNEVSPCPEAAAANWDRILKEGDKAVDRKILSEAVKAGMYVH